MADVMHALRGHDHGGPGDLVYEEAPVPTLGTGDVLLRVSAASLTPTELTWASTWVDRRGLDRRPVIPCHEVSGVVVERGYGAAHFDVGDVVFGLTDWYRDGAAAEYVAVEARNLARRPRGCSPVEAAAVSLAGLTGWQALFDYGGLATDGSVLITGATGGVGSIAVQLAHGVSATVIAAGHASQAQLAADLGAKEFIDVDDADWAQHAGRSTWPLTWWVVASSTNWHGPASPVGSCRWSSRMTKSCSLWSSPIGPPWPRSRATSTRAPFGRSSASRSRWPMGAPPFRPRGSPVSVCSCQRPR
jgi:NADPH:quinone reductase-like Zn-dependent oxidoreductase